MDTALPDVVQALGKALFDERFGREDQTITLQPNFQIISRRQPQLVVQLLWNHDLSADPDFDNRQGPIALGLYFHIFIFYEVEWPCQLKREDV